MEYYITSVFIYVRFGLVVIPEKFEEEVVNFTPKVRERPDGPFLRGQPDPSMFSFSRN